MSIPIPPEAVDPATYGLSWGSPRSAARRAIRKALVAEGEHALLFRHTWDNRDYRTLLSFAPNQGLIQIALTLVQTRAFLDDSWSLTDLDQLEEHTRRQFHSQIAQYSAALGPPSFSGDANSRGFPAGESALELAEWHLASGRLRLRFDQPDQEAPLYVELLGSPPAD